jgi:hypothetical protein
MRAAGVLTVLTGALLIGGHGHAASGLSLLRHALRVLT